MVAAAQLLADGSFVGVKIPSELQKRAQCRRSAAALSPSASLSVFGRNRSSDRTSSSSEKRVDVLSHAELKFGFESEVFPASEGFYFEEARQR